MRFSNSSLAMVAALLLGFTGANATAQTYQAPTNQPRTDQAPGAKSDITIVKDNAANAPGGTGVEESTESQGATNKQGLSEATPPASGAGQWRAGPATDSLAGR